MNIKHKNISTQANLLLSKLRNSDTKCFHLMDAYKLLPDNSSVAIRKLLSDMTSRGLFMRLKQGLYYVVPFEEDAAIYMPEWHGIAGCLATGTDYYIGYYSAMQIHQLITQPSLKEQIVVSKQMTPSEIQIKKVSFQFIYHNASHFFGWTNKWVDSYQKVKCSDLEKTIIDSLFRPDYAGGITEIAKAIFICQHQLNYNRLLDYAERFKSRAVIKRLGFLLELMEIENSIIERLHSYTTSSYILLDPSLPKTGKHSTRWHIYQNLDSATIKSSMYT